MNSETAMQVGRVYLVITEGGQAYFGVLKKRFFGCCFIGGFFARYVPGFFDEASVKRIVHFDSPHNNETEQEWIDRNPELDVFL